MSENDRVFHLNHNIRPSVWTVSLQSEAEDLYGLVPQEFTTNRNARAREVRADGDRELAERIRKLPKPRLAAWVLNMLTRRLPGEVDKVVALGAAIRTAQASAGRDELRSLDDQRRQLTSALTQQAKVIAADLGHPVNDPMAAEIEKKALERARDAAAETERTLERAAQSHAAAVTRREQLESERAELGGPSGPGGGFQDRRLIRPRPVCAHRK